jgi:hypothetical protein
MAAHATADLAPAGLEWPLRGLLLGVRVRLTSARLDARLTAGEPASSDAELSCRAAQLVSARTRRRIVAGLERLWSPRSERSGLSAAIPFDRPAVWVARPALEQLAMALRSREMVHPRGVILAERLLSDPCSPLYRPVYGEQLYEAAREALFALGRR